MEIVTDTPFTKCSNCKCEIDTYYYYPDLFAGKVCIKCLVSINKGYPSGICPYIPCKLCQWPSIRWYKIDIKDCIKSNCGYHHTIDSDGLDII